MPMVQNAQVMKKGMTINMKKRKPYYMIIAALCFATIISIFLPYLKLPERPLVSGVSVLNAEQAALRSRIVSRIAESEGLRRTIVNNIAKGIIREKAREDLTADLSEEDYYMVDMVSDALDQKIAEVEVLDDFNGTTYSLSDMVRLAVSVMKHLEQDYMDSVLLILCVFATLLLPLIAGSYMLITKGRSKYGLVRRLSLITAVLCLLGLINSNALSIGALQVTEFYTDNWGAAFFLIMILSAAAWLTATIASYHENVEGFVTWKLIIRQKQLILLALPFVIYAFIFNYAPLAGWIMAFQKYKPAAENQLWVAWDKFKFLFANAEFLQVFRNTVAMSVINLIFSFFFAIAFALLLNEVVNLKGKKFVQTVSYLPHFLSWIIVAGIVRDVLSMETGIINEILVKTGLINTPINFFADPKYFWWIVGWAVVWKETGWNSIIYLSSMTSISPDLYEAAAIDGAGRLKKMWHITLPGIRPTIFVLLIINLGMIMNSGFEAQYLLGGDLNKSASQVIDIYVLKYSFGAGIDFSLGTAAGIFKSVVSILLIFIANRAARVAGQERLF